MKHAISGPNLVGHFKNAQNMKKYLGWIFFKYVSKIVDFSNFKMYENLTVGQKTTLLTQDFFC